MKMASQNEIFYDDRVFIFKNQGLTSKNFYLYIE